MKAKTQIFVLDAEVFDKEGLEYDYTGMQKACNQPKVIDMKKFYEG
jgi:hypothetical protein